MYCFFDIEIEEESENSIFPRISKIEYVITGQNRKSIVIDTPNGTHVQEYIGMSIETALNTFLKDINKIDILVSSNTKEKILCIEKEMLNLGKHLELEHEILDVIFNLKNLENMGFFDTLDRTFLFYIGEDLSKNETADDIDNITKIEEIFYKFK